MFLPNEIPSKFKLRKTVVLSESFWRGKVHSQKPKVVDTPP